jgi:F-type H+-transporting ATPase subunit gamma
MPSTRGIRRRIKSITNIGQITKAMELVAASRMRRAQETALAGRRYTFTMDAMLKSLLSHTDPAGHPLLRQYEDLTDIHGQSGKVLVLVFGPDKGLCGGLVTNLMREVARFMQTEDEVEFVTMGKRARQAVRKLNGTIVADVPLHERPRLNDVLVMSNVAIEGFSAGTYKKVMIANTRFVSTLKQQAQVIPLLPLSPELVGQRLEAMTGSEPQVMPTNDHEYTYEPSVETVLMQLLPRYVEMTVFEALLEALASEYSARMMAMKNAGDNARELQQELNLTYNQLRQAAITAELAEISSAAG